LSSVVFITISFVTIGIEYLDKFTYYKVLLKNETYDKIVFYFIPSLFLSIGFVWQNLISWDFQLHIYNVTSQRN